jgi:hypothetical protein
MARTNFDELRREVVARPGAKERLAAARAQTLEEMRLYELRHAEAISQVELAGRLNVTQGAISKLEHAEDVRISTLRQYLGRSPGTDGGVRRRGPPSADPARPGRHLSSIWPCSARWTADQVTAPGRRRRLLTAMPRRGSFQARTCPTYVDRRVLLFTGSLGGFDPACTVYPIIAAEPFPRELPEGYLRSAGGLSPS